jgi:hypothetical protein
MRELTKSMLGYGWAMSVFGLQQMVNLLTPVDGDPCGKAAHSFDNVTEATAQTFGGAVKEAYKAGDSLQRGTLDIMFGGWAAGGLDPNSWLRAGADAVKKAADFGRSTAESASQAAGFSPGNSAGPKPAPANPGASSSPGTDWGPMPR